MIGLFAAVALVVTVISCACNSVISARAEKAKAGLANVQQRCQSITRETDTAKAELDQQQWQDQLAKVSDSWLSVMNSALDSLPSDAWVTRIETSPKDSTLLIEGRAASFDSLSTFIGGLRRNRAFADIRLASARIVGIGSLTCVEFSLPIKLSATTGVGDPAASAKANELVARRPGA